MLILIIIVSIRKYEILSFRKSALSRLCQTTALTNVVINKESSYSWALNSQFRLLSAAPLHYLIVLPLASLILSRASLLRLLAFSMLFRAFSMLSRAFLLRLLASSMLSLKRRCSLSRPGTAISDPKFGVYIIYIYADTDIYWAQRLSGSSKRAFSQSNHPFSLSKSPLVLSSEPSPIVIFAKILTSRRTHTSEKWPAMVTASAGHSVASNFLSLCPTPEKSLESPSLSSTWLRRTWYHGNSIHRPEWNSLRLGIGRRGH